MTESHSSWGRREDGLLRRMGSTVTGGQRGHVV